MDMSETVIAVAGDALKGLERGLEELEVRERLEANYNSALQRSAKILETALIGFLSVYVTLIMAPLLSLWGLFWTSVRSVALEKEQWQTWGL